jgi:UDP-N-acetylglucosamine--N-acetylmuramyl-(pentapeptide) pyrophosphoryl-undecaprenol N-acetylglucosamine transferase
MRVLIGCGGTGGHIYPAISIADALRCQIPDVEILFVGAKGGMEMNLIPAVGYSIKGIDIRGMPRGKWLKTIQWAYVVLKSIFQAWSICALFKPNVVIGTGGYAAFPPLFAAYTKRIPTLIHEQNSKVGVANQFLARYVTKICLGYEEVTLSCPEEKIIATGNPVRPYLHKANLDKLDRQKVFQYFNLSPNKKCLLIMGGSQGAKELNKIILKKLSAFQQEDIQLVWITGNRYFEEINRDISTHPHAASIRCYPFLTKIEMAYAAADVFIARAGALSIAEICVAQKPSILVPSPNVTNDHQTENALSLVYAGAALLLSESQCPDLLMPFILDLLKNQAKKTAMIQKMSPFAQLHAHALPTLVKEIITLASRQMHANP